MCRNIKTLFNFEPPASDDEVRADGLSPVYGSSPRATRLTATSVMRLPDTESTSSE
jgi:hypothetical protein